MKKKSKNISGQVSLFIIISLMIIGAVVIAYTFRDKLSSVINTGKRSVFPEVSVIDSSIESCARQRAIDAVRIVGLQGGYVNLPKDYLVTNISNIAYGYYNGKNTLASKSVIEKEISSYTQLTMPFCIGNQYDNFNITKSEASATTKINSNSVSVTAKMPLSAIKEKQAFTINKNYNIEIPVRLGNMIDISNEIIAREIKEPNYIPLSYLAGLDYNILAMPNDNNNMVYAIVDTSNKSSIDEIPYSFMFADKFGASK